MSPKTFENCETTAFEQGDNTFTCKIVTEKERLLCPIENCLRRFDKEGALTRHLSQNHGISAAGYSVCPVCDVDFYNPDENECCSISCALTKRYSEDES